MSIEGPIQTNNSGLIFYFDAKEPKSYAGKPTTNYLTAALTPNSATKESFTGTITENSIIAPDGTLTAHRFQVTSGYVYQTLTIPVGTTVTYSVWIKTLDVVSTTSYGPYIWNYNSPTYGIVARDLSGVGLDWKRMSMTYTTLSHQSSFAISYAGTNGGMQGLYALWRPQLEYSLSATPFVNGTRSNTQGLLDLIGGSTIDLTNAGYDGSSEITFNGSSNYITINKTATQLGLVSGGQMTAEVFVRLSSLSGYTHIVDGSGGRWHLAVEDSAAGASAYFYNGSSYHSTSSPAITANTWVHIAGVQEASLLKIYINGVLATNGSLSSASSNLLQDCNVAIGYWQGSNARYLNGQIGYARIYNRALSAAEILKNFNSQRSRYSV